MTKQLLTTRQLFHLAVCAFGIQFASSLMMANMSSIFKFFGAASGNLPYLWLAAPVSGLVIQPLIGQLSDDTLTRYGKRRPYILVWSLITFLCFSLIPLVKHLWLMVILFWGIGCGINGVTEALRALIGDITPGQQKTQAFSWQTIFAGSGATLAAILPYFFFKWEYCWQEFLKKLPSFNLVPYSIQMAFVLGGSILLGSVLWTLSRIQEPHVAQVVSLRKHYQTTKASFSRKVKHFFGQLTVSIEKLPIVIRKFIVVQVFTWIGLYSMWLYFTLAIAQHIYGLPVGADVTQNVHYAEILENSTIKTGVYFGIYQFVSIFYAIGLPFLVKKVDPKLIHAASLLIGAIGLIIIVVAHTGLMIVIGVVAIGIMWGSIMTLPYAIVTAGVPRSKMGVYLGIFNITITAPQIICGLSLGFIYTTIFHNHAIYCILLAGVSIFIAGSLLVWQCKKERLLL
jgi:maltose/moltooligosaccharide transporter